MPNLINPVDGQLIPVDATITWNLYQSRLMRSFRFLQVQTIYRCCSGKCYFLHCSFNENTEIFVTIVLSFRQDRTADIICEVGSFTTEDVTTPDCTQISVPSDGATGVSVFTNISWLAKRATAYDIVRTAPGLGDLYTVNDITNLSFFSR